MSSERIFTSLQLGSSKIRIERIALAPLTRLRAAEGSQAPRAMAAEYYTQRSSPGTLLITEATFIAKEAGGYPRAPGIYSSEQIEGWKAVAKGVHSKGGLIYCQLWALGRANSDPPLHGYDPSIKTVSCSPIPIKGREKFKVEPLELHDIKRYIGHYAQAAKNAIESGLDGVEIHGANGYLIDQFLQTNSNERTDSYGGSIENRCKFALEVMGAVVKEIGEGRTGIRLSPWSTFQDMQMPNPYPTFKYLIKEIKARFPKLAYIHFVEPIEWVGGTYREESLEKGLKSSNDPFRAIIRGVAMNDEIDGPMESFEFPDPDEANPTLVLSAAGHTDKSAPGHVQRTGDVAAFGRWFISNPDLPYRLKNHIPFAQYDRNTFYTHDEEGYTTYPFCDHIKSN